MNRASLANSVPLDEESRDPPKVEFSLSEARTIVGGFFRPNPWIYWPDLLVSWTVGLAAFTLAPREELGWPLRSVCFLISSLLIYRCGLFIHELVHIPEGEFIWFRKVWNVTVGIPFLIPSFIYLTHVDHHRRKHYGTQADGEYLPFSNRPPWHIVSYLLQSFVIPPLAVIRFGVLTPLTWFSSPLRDWVYRHASSMIIDPTYLRPHPTAKTLRVIRHQETLTFLYLLISSALIYQGAFHEGWVNPWVLLQAYLTAVFIVTVNAVRTVGAHRYLNEPDHEMTFLEQMLDSLNYPTWGSFSWLWAPVGLRYHALHHIFPSMPYHAMAKAHRRLMHELPAGSPYRQTVTHSLWRELANLWHRAAASRRARKTAG